VNTAGSLKPLTVFIINVLLIFSELPSIYTLHKNKLFHLPAASITKTKKFYKIETMSATKTW
jgi:hypothetical protein